MVLRSSFLPLPTLTVYYTAKILHVTVIASVRHLWLAALSAFSAILHTPFWVSTNSSGGSMKKLIQIVAVLKKADPALAVTLQFVAFGMAWILFSDSLLYILGSDNILWRLAHIHMLKGLFFVGVTGGFIFYWMNQYVISGRQKDSEISNLFHASPLAMGIVDSATFRFIEVNESLIKMYGYSRTEFLSLALEDLAALKQEYETLPLLIKTGSTQPGTWRQLRKNKEQFCVDFTAQPIRDKKAWLIMFADATEKVEVENELKRIKQVFEQRLNHKVEDLTRANEELAYRASQTEHVNTELIAVNERLQMVNKKIVSQSEENSWRNATVNEVLLSMTEVMWSFDLSGKARHYISPSAEVVFDTPIELLNQPWFWLDLLHPEEEALREFNQQRLLEQGECSFMARILSKRGTVRMMHFRIKIVEQKQKGTASLVGFASDMQGQTFDNGVPVIAGNTRQTSY